MKDISQTLYIPLVARIYISKKFPNFFYDEHCLKLESLELLTCAEYEAFASVSRTKIFDELARAFANTKEKIAIIHLGAGLDTQNYRLQDIKNAHFYNLDFPEVIKLRTEVLGTASNETLIAQDLFNFSWIKEIKEDKVFFIASGVFQYFDEQRIILLLQELKKSFPKQRIIFDATNKLGIKLANFFVKFKAKIKNATMNFYVNNAELLAQKSQTKLITELPFFTETLKIKNLKLSSRISMLWANKFKMAKIIILKL